MTRRIRYTDEFKREAVAQVTDRGYSVKDVAGRLGVCTKSIYDWMKRYGPAEPERDLEDEQKAEVRRLKAELARVTEERDILKKATAYFASESR
jgi:transposase